MTTDAATGQAASTPAPNGAVIQNANPSAPPPAQAGLLSGAPDAAPAPAADAKPVTQGHNSGGHFDQSGNWREGLAQGLDEETGKVWNNIAGRYTTPADMAKAHVNLVQQMDKRIPLPGDNAKPEEWDQVFQKLGMPDTPDGYKWDKAASIQHWDDGRREQLKGLAPMFRKARATQAQVDEFIEQQAELDKLDADAARARANTLAQQRDRQMQTEWRGEDYQRNRNLAATWVRTYAGADVNEAASLQLSDGTFALDHPVLQRMFAKAASERAEDDRDPTAFNATQRESVKSQIKQLEDEAIAKGLSPTHPQWPHAKLEPLYAKSYGKRNDYAANKQVY